MLITSYNSLCKKLTIVHCLRRHYLTHKTIISESALHSTEWDNAKPFDHLPGPTKFQLLKEFLPGGRYYNKSLVEMNAQLRCDYGDILKIPGVFGKRNLVYAYNPDDYKMVFRTEGLQPIRRGLDVIHYHRKILRTDVFKHAAGLVAEQGEGWAHFRHTVNPVMMNPKTIRKYSYKMNKVADEFLKRIKTIRNVKNNEMPVDFEDELNSWAMDSVGLIALDTELGMINNRAGNPEATAVIDGMREFFELLFQLDIQPSLWKVVATPKFNRIINRLDIMTDLTIYYIDAAIKRLQANQQASTETTSESERSVLERLINIDRTVAIVMAMDMLLAGIDTTTSALVGCLLCLSKNPEKQAKLRAEICEILPEKDSPITSTNLDNAPYLRACIKEGMRCYPVSTGNFRSTGQDVVLSGYRIPKDTDIAMPGQLLMYDSKYFGYPNEFIPERWLRTHRNDTTSSNCPLNSNVPFVYLPFGFGPRICIGKRIVDLELEVILAKLIRNFHIEFNYPMENIFRTHIINVPNKPLQFTLNDL